MITESEFSQITRGEETAAEVAPVPAPRAERVAEAPDVGAPAGEPPRNTETPAARNRRTSRSPDGPTPAEAAASPAPPTAAAPAPAPVAEPCRQLPARRRPAGLPRPSKVHTPLTPRPTPDAPHVAQGPGGRAAPRPAPAAALALGARPGAGRGRNARRRRARRRERVAQAETRAREQQERERREREQGGSRRLGLRARGGPAREPRRGGEDDRFDPVPPSPRSCARRRDARLHRRRPPPRRSTARPRSAPRAGGRIALSPKGNRCAAARRPLRARAVARLLEQLPARGRRLGAENPPRRGGVAPRAERRRILRGELRRW